MGIADCFAGRGEYADGAAGSPVLLARLAHEFERREGRGFRELECFYIEKDRPTFDHLETVLASYSHRYTARHGTLGQHIDEMLERLSGIPALFFLDPFGSLPPIGDISEKLMGRTGITEVLLNFMIPNLRRKSGWLLKTPQSPHGQSIIRNLDRVLDGDWWHALCRDNELGWEFEVLRSYAQRLKARTGADPRVVAVRQSPDRTPIYYLILLTRSRHGVWYFNEAVARAQHAFQQRYGEQGDLFAPPDDRGALAQHVKGNIERLCREERRPFRLRDHIDAVLDGVLGRAHSVHVRDAIAQLEGKVLRAEASGELINTLITPIEERP